MEAAIEGRLLTYHRTGRGPATIVMIPGGPGFVYESLEIIHEQLSDIGATVISYNPSGSGQDGNPYYKSISAYASELNQFLKATSHGDIILLGHSFGTAIVQEHLALHPEANVKGIILVNGFSSGGQLVDAINMRGASLPREFHTQRHELLQNGNGDGYDQLLFQYWLPQFVCRLDPLPGAVVQCLLANREAAASYYYIGRDVLNIDGAILKWTRTGNLKNIQVPSLLVSGPFDYLQKSEFEDMSAQVPGAVTAYIDGTSHFPMFEQPEQFKQAMIRFLKPLL